MQFEPQPRAHSPQLAAGFFKIRAIVLLALPAKYYMLYKDDELVKRHQGLVVWTPLYADSKGAAMEFHPQYWHWLVFGMVLVIAGLIIPSFTIFWFGLAGIIIKAKLKTAISDDIAD
jgi:hypothetical protein